MKWMGGYICIITLVLAPGLWGQEVADIYSPGTATPAGGDGGAPSPGPHHRGRGHRGPGIQFQQFRQEVRALGEEIRENERVIRSLEEEMNSIEPGVSRAEVGKKLAESRRRQAELQLELALKKVTFTSRARDIAQQRYDEARLDLERVREKIRKDYPDLADRPVPVFSPPTVGVER